jgi:hypothetical protein
MHSARVLGANPSTSGTPARDDAFEDRRDAFEDVRERSWIGVERRELGRSGEHDLGANVRARSADTLRGADEVALVRLADLTDVRTSTARELASFACEPVLRGRAAGVDVEGALAAPLRPEHDVPARPPENGTPDERLVLLAVDDEQGVVHSDEDRRTERLSGAVQRAAAALRRDVVAELADGSWTISEPLLDEWPDHAAGDRARDREAV